MNFYLSLFFTILQKFFAAKLLYYFVSIWFFRNLHWYIKLYQFIRKYINLSWFSRFLKLLSNPLNTAIFQWFHRYWWIHTVSAGKRNKIIGRHSSSVMLLFTFSILLLDVCYLPLKLRKDTLFRKVIF